MERKLTQEQEEHIEALIRTHSRMIGRLEMELERLKSEKKGHETFLRDYGQPVLIPSEDGDAKTNAMLKEIIDGCDRGEENNLRMLMATKRVKCLGSWIEVK